MGAQRGLREGLHELLPRASNVWFEQHATAEAAITREKQIKRWNRAWKVRAIEVSNPYWNDLFESVHQ